MSNRILNLHSKCKKYHLKKNLKIFSFFVFVSLSLVGYYYKDDLSSKLKANINNSKEKKKNSQKNIHKEDNSSPVYVVPVSKQELEKSILKVSHKKKEAKKDNQKNPVYKNNKSQKSTDYIHSAQTKREENKQNFFSYKTKEHPIEDWISKYENKKSYTLAIYISNYFYKKKDYRRAGIWAKRANKLDKTQEKAWIIYAKSVYALGKKKKAKDILKLFTQYKKSIKAEMLLSEWDDKR